MDIYTNELFTVMTEIIFSSNNRNHREYQQGIEEVFNIFCEHKSNQSSVYFIGNGGSAAISSHMTADYMKNGGMNTFSLYDAGLTTCMGNDYGYEFIFSRPMNFLVKPGDLVVAISSSGNSKNIVNAINVAKEKGAYVLTFTGFEADNICRALGDYNVYVPCKKYGMVESIHTIILQEIVDLILEKDGVEI